MEKIAVNPQKTLFYGFSALFFRISKNIAHIFGQISTNIYVFIHNIQMSKLQG